MGLRVLRLTLSVGADPGSGHLCTTPPVLQCWPCAQVRSLEDALVAELCPSEDGGHFASRTGLLLRRLEACAPADEDFTSANPLQVRTAFSLALQRSVIPHLCELVLRHPRSALSKDLANQAHPALYKIQDKRTCDRSKSQCTAQQQMHTSSLSDRSLVR